MSPVQRTGGVAQQSPASSSRARLSLQTLLHSPWGQSHLCSPQPDSSDLPAVSAHGSFLDVSHLEVLQRTTFAVRPLPSNLVLRVRPTLLFMAEQCTIMGREPVAFVHSSGGGRLGCPQFGAM